MITIAADHDLLPHRPPRLLNRAHGEGSPGAFEKKGRPDSRGLLVFATQIPGEGSRGEGQAETEHANAI